MRLFKLFTMPERPSTEFEDNGLRIIKSGRTRNMQAPYKHIENPRQIAAIRHAKRMRQLQEELRMSPT